MKSTDHFKRTIKEYLDKRVETDVLFDKSYSNPKKNIDDCITCILNTVQKSGCSGFTDDEVYSMAVHYYDEDNINVGNPINCNVVVNRVVELTEEEKEQAHKDAIKRVQEEAYNKIKQPVKKAKTVEVNSQISLFE